MTFPNRCSVSIDGVEIQALAAKFELRSSRDQNGHPEMGICQTVICAWFDLHDRRNLPFSTYTALFQLANRPTVDKIVPMEVRFWDDESHADVVAAFSFDGWISVFSTESPRTDEATLGPKATS